MLDLIIEEMKRRTSNRVRLIRESTVPEEESKFIVILFLCIIKLGSLRSSFIGFLFEEVRIYREFIQTSVHANRKFCCKKK